MVREALTMFPIDWTTLSGKTGHYEGHFMILTGIEENGDLLIHDPDFGPFKKYSKVTLAKGYSRPEITDDLVLCFGKKNN